jgi:hypothetical protein
MLAVRMETCWRIGGSEAAESWLLAVGCWSDAGCADGTCWRIGWIGGWLLAAGCWLLAAGRMLAVRMETCWRIGGSEAAGELAAGCWRLAAGRMLAVRMETCWRIGGSEAAGELAAGCWLLVGCWLCGWKRAGG